ncbi:hypothetical protein TrVE_jg9547 [Triparma verrucosa]|uniref:Uncharacterized protein n=1 Tax=Triparma verrucosa TaxID=1606542 RepID=A0A9W7BUN9_9STRA|nr:hypothetical protein TrVE_jg9547 [Triparma verrucosa]
MVCKACKRPALTALVKNLVELVRLEEIRSQEKFQECESHSRRRLSIIVFNRNSIPPHRSLQTMKRLQNPRPKNPKSPPHLHHKRCLKRPFPALKALDIEDVIEKVKAAMD